MTEKLNAEVNRRLKAVAARQLTPIVEYTAMGDVTGSTKEPDGYKSCDKERLLTDIKAALTSAWFGNMETWAEDNVPNCEVRGSNSVYRYVSNRDGGVMSFAGLNPSVRVGDQIIGVDKLSHFMTEGSQYYTKFASGASLEEVLEQGTSEEDGYYGLGATGIKSYADMAADYKGFLFFKNIFDGTNPYFRCSDGILKQVRQFDWRDYVDASLNESINCNAYFSKGMADAVARGISELGSRNSLPSYKCPANQRVCTDLKTKISNPIVLQAIISPRCLIGQDESPVAHTEGSGWKVDVLPPPLPMENKKIFKVSPATDKTRRKIHVPPAVD